MERQLLALVEDQVALLFELDVVLAEDADTVGGSPSKPSSTALSVPCPRPVMASDPYSSARTRTTRSSTPFSSSQRSENRAAARMGPTVWEDDGPMPILKMSKALTAMGVLR
jgi:hypothetical protein